MAEKKSHIRSKCKGCGKKIIFLLSHVSGKYVPCEVEGVKPEDVYFNIKEHVSHFAMCPNAKELRKGDDGQRRERRMYEKGELPSAEEIMRDRERVLAEFRKKLEKDHRPVILNQKHVMTIPRYTWVNMCAEAGLDFDSLISWETSALREWWNARSEMSGKEDRQTGHTGADMSLLPEGGGLFG